MRRHVVEEVEDYLRGLLEPETSRHFEQHIERCRRCEKTLRDARLARSCLRWLQPREEPPKPSPAFYFKVRAAIGKRRGGGWFGDLIAALPPRLAYPLLSLAALLMIWSLTYRPAGAVEDLFELALPPTQLANLYPADTAGTLSRDLVLLNLVDLSEVEQD